MAALALPLIKTAASAFIGSKVAKAVAPKPPPAPAAPAQPAEALTSEPEPQAAAQTQARSAARTVFSVAKQASGKRKNAVSATSTQLSGSSNKLG
jgi:hypothetical protein